ncbi:hypothetical protein D5366_03075 [Neokomagataea tanensis]|uniref:Uncharacterized protein n=1 Tax=Neokomagataea tanensis TaxID=661191 RepID=A0A4Y6V2Z2_9PROT|nr:MULTISPECIES: hypothetical protein [Neokomagataea]QDH24399.1 hypothetical protein D5366_03075 [Neokomagataea tanensis]
MPTPLLHSVRRLRLPLTLISACVSWAWSSTAWAQAASHVVQTGQYAPGARSSATANGAFDSVIGQHPQMVTSSVQSNGVTYYVTPEGRIVDDKGYYLAPDPSRNTRFASYSAQKARIPPDAKLVPIFIGVMDTSMVANNHLHFHGCEKLTHPLIHSPIDPPGVFVAPAPCSLKQGSAHSLIHSTAEILAGAHGNLYGLAGNRDQLDSATQAIRISDHETRLVMPSPNQTGTPNR